MREVLFTTYSAGFLSGVLVTLLLFGVFWFLGGRERGRVSWVWFWVALVVLVGVVMVDEATGGWW